MKSILCSLFLFLDMAANRQYLPCLALPFALPIALITGHLLHLSMERAKERLGLKDDSYERDQKQEALHRHNITNSK